MRPTARPTRTAHSRRAFSLLELLVVVAIIALLIGILVPALGGARNSAKTTATRAMMADFGNAASQFGLDNSGRLPGLFTQAELGSQDNADAGLSAAENALLELMGGDALLGRVSDVDSGVVSLPTGINAADLIKVGVSTSDKDRQYYLNPSLLGAGQGAYYTPDKKFLVQQLNDGGTSFSQFSDTPRSSLAQQFANTGSDGFDTMPDLVDAFGTPVLLWASNEFGPRRVRTTDADDALDDFVRSTSDASPTQSGSFFYLTANKAFLAATSLGRAGNDQTATSGKTSLIGTRNGSFNDDARRSFAALIANPAYHAIIGGGDLAGAAVADIVPTTPRGSFVLHSAGVDGFYFGAEDPGFGRARLDQTYAQFGLTLKTDNGAGGLRTEGGQAASYDLSSGFDDILFTTK